MKNYKYIQIKNLPKDVYRHSKYGNDECTEFICECGTIADAKFIIRACNKYNKSKEKGLKEMLLRFFLQARTEPTIWGGPNWKKMCEEAESLLGDLVLEYKEK